MDSAPDQPPEQIGRMPGERAVTSLIQGPFAHRLWHRRRCNQQPLQDRLCRQPMTRHFLARHYPAPFFFFHDRKKRTEKLRMGNAQPRHVAMVHGHGAGTHGTGTHGTRLAASILRCDPAAFRQERHVRHGTLTRRPVRAFRNHSAPEAWVPEPNA